MVVLAGQNVNVTRVDMLIVQVWSHRGGWERGSKGWGLECPHPTW